MTQGKEPTSEARAVLQRGVYVQLCHAPICAKIGRYLMMRLTLCKHPDSLLLLDDGLFQVIQELSKLCQVLRPAVGAKSWDQPTAGS